NLAIRKHNRGAGTALGRVAAASDFSGKDVVGSSCPSAGASRARRQDLSDGKTLRESKGMRDAIERCSVREHARALVPAKKHAVAWDRSRKANQGEIRLRSGGARRK